MSESGKQSKAQSLWKFSAVMNMVAALGFMFAALMQSRSGRSGTTYIALGAVFIALGANAAVQSRAKGKPADGGDEEA